MNIVISKIINNIVSNPSWKEKAGLKSIVKRLKKDYNLDIHYQIVLDILVAYGHLNSKFIITLKDEEIIEKEKLIEKLDEETRTEIESLLFDSEYKIEDIIIYFEKNHFKISELKIISFLKQDEETLIKLMLHCLDSSREDRIKYLSSFKSRFDFDYNFTFDDIFNISKSNILSFNITKKYCNDNYIKPIINKCKIEDLSLVENLSQNLYEYCHQQFYDLRIIQKLIDNGANVNYNDGQIIIYCTQYLDKIEIVELLLKYNAKLSFYKYQALTNALNSGIQMFDLVIKYI